MFHSSFVVRWINFWNKFSLLIFCFHFWNLFFFTKSKFKKKLNYADLLLTFILINNVIVYFEYDNWFYFNFLGNYNSNGQISILKSNADHIDTVSSGESDTKPKNVHHHKVIKTADDQSCAERLINDFYVDEKTGCKSRKKIRTLKCKNQCQTQSPAKLMQSNQTPFGYIIGTNKKQISRSLNENESCCKASQTKLKKLKLFCDDGSTIMADITIVKKCTCSNECSRSAN